MKEYIGIGMILTLFAGFFTFVLYLIGLKETLIVFGATALLVGWISYAIWLIGGE